MDPESAAALAQDLLIFSKFSQSSSLSPLNLIDYRNKSETNDFLVEAKRRLKSTICDLFKRNAQGNMENAIDRRLRRTFVPIKILKGKNVCSKCEKTYTVRINQFRLKYNPGCTQQRKDIAGKKFSDHPSVNYLNLIDYSCKAYDFVPYHLTWNFEREIFSHLLPLIEKDIKNFPVKLLPLLLTKHITVLKLLNMESNSPVSLNFYYKIIDAVLDKEFPETLLILDIWRALFFSERLLVCAFEKLTEHLPYSSNERLKLILMMASYLRFDFYGAWMRGNKLQNFPNCPVTAALAKGNYKQMKTLLDYGFLRNSRPFASYNVLLRNLVRLDDRLAQPFESARFGPDPFVREVLMFLIIKYIHKDDEDLSWNLDRCFYLLWSVIPNPIVTKYELIEDVYQLFDKYPNNDYTAEQRREMETIITTYDEMAFAPITESTPRSLRHLCRCVIRKCLTFTGNLPNGVTKLQIPKDLETYLLLTYPEEIK